jgi:formylglycine-generating enzyme required for sulfatase activity
MQKPICITPFLVSLVLFPHLVAESKGQASRTMTNSIGMKLVLISKGNFTMGSPPGEKGSEDNERQYQVEIKDDFYLGAFEVTQSQYEQVIGSNPSWFQGDRIATLIPAKKHPETGRTIEEKRLIAVESDNHPVDGVGWEEAVEFCNQLSNLPEEKSEGRVYRLPTEAEWEYACRAGKKTTFSFGPNEKKLGDYAWFRENSDAKTHPVGKKKPNAWGVYDMYGNVGEWCSDWYFIYPEGTVANPMGPKTGIAKIYRGGSWFHDAANCRSAVRKSGIPPKTDFYIGFRVALSREVPESQEIDKK